MKKISAAQVRKIRDKTGAPVLRAKKVLEEVGGDEKKAEKVLRKEGFEKIAKRTGRQTGQGLIKAYVHHNGKIASLVEIFTETDFVARNELFEKLAHNLALQVASMNPKNSKELEKQVYIKDPSKKVADLVKEVMAKTGENIRIGRIFRVELGKK
jgi:elongation factor Ts